MHVGKQRARCIGGRGGEWRKQVVTGLWYVRFGEFCSSNLAHIVPSGVDLQTADGDGCDAAVGARKIGPGCAGAKVLSGISAKGMADYDPSVARTSGRGPALSFGFAGRSRSRQYKAFQ